MRNTMNLAARSRASFEELTRTIGRYWALQGDGAPQTEQIVLVDLQHNDLNCLLGCLTGAKYVSYLTGAGLVGVVGQNATQRWDGRPEDYDESTIRQLAESFGMQLFLPADLGSLRGFVADRPDLAESIRADLGRFDAVWGTDGDPDWIALGRFESADGADCGRGVADSAAKVTGSPRPGRESAALVRDLMTEALHLRAFTGWVCDTAEVISYVTSHICYAGWATIATTVSERGGRVVLAESLPNGTSFNIIEPGRPADSRIGDRRAAGVAQLFDELMTTQGPTHEGMRAKTAALLGAPVGPAAGWWKVDQASTVDRSAGSALRRQALDKLAVADTERPVCFVLSHCLTDAARQESCLYDDYYEWLVATLEVARETDDRLWVIRLHPWHRMYREGAVADALKERFGGLDHICFDDGLLSKDEYFSACDLAVTVRGTAAWELARFGIPVIGAGRSWYERAGFVHVPHSVQAYEQLLRRPIAELVELPGDPDAALSFAMMVLLLLPLSSPLCPPREDYPYPSLITALTSRYRSTVLELDPAFRAMSVAWLERRGATMNGDLMALLAEDVVAAPAHVGLRQELARWADHRRAA